MGPIRHPIDLLYDITSISMIAAIVPYFTFRVYLKKIKNPLAHNTHRFLLLTELIVLVLTSIVFYAEGVFVVFWLYYFGLPVWVACFIAAKFYFKLKIVDAVKLFLITTTIAASLIFLNIVIFNDIVDPMFKYCTETLLNICPRS